MRSVTWENERATETARPTGLCWSARFKDGSEQKKGEGTPRFTLCVADRQALEYVLSTDAYSAAAAFIRGGFDVEGDLEAAIRFRGWHPRSGVRKYILGALARGAERFQSSFQTRAQAARNIRFHYDRSNDFYRLFLDPRMVYSCAYFRTPETTLEEAQIAKLDLICRKLDLQPGEHFLDVGCGWGALVAHAAGQYGVAATGCTLSRAQHDHALATLRGRADVFECDYRNLGGSYDKIASIGMFEHVGRRRAHEYFHKLAGLLEPNGLLLNHAIARPAGDQEDASNLFVRRHIFPGAELIYLWETLRAAEESGFEVLDVENLRPHYALTCRQWLHRLTGQREAALRIVNEATIRTWRIWLAACALSFEEGCSSVYQVLMSKRGAPRRRMTREHMHPDIGRR